jgi:hypothetical protein
MGSFLPQNLFAWYDGDPKKAREKGKDRGVSKAEGLIPVPHAKPISIACYPMLARIKELTL